MASTTVLSNAIVLEVLNQHNYDDWSSRVESYLLAEDLWDVVTATPPKQEDGEAEYIAWSKKNAKAVHAIKISCGTQLFSFIRNIDKAREAWLELKSQFKPYFAMLSETPEIYRHTPIRDLQIKVEELVPADDGELEIKVEGGNENNANCEFDSSYVPFFNSVLAGDWENVKQYLAKPNPNAVRAINPAGGFTALHAAILGGHVHIVRELVRYMTQEDLERKTTDGTSWTPLHYAAAYGNVDIVKELIPLMRKKNLEMQDSSGFTALHLAICERKIDMVKLLIPLMRKEGLEIQDSSGFTALHLAIRERKIDMVKLLIPLMRKEGLEIQDSLGRTALHCAVIMDNVDIVKELVPLMRKESFEITDSEGCTTLHRAVIGENVDMVKGLIPLMRKEVLKIQDRDGSTALHCAVKNKKVDMWKELALSMRTEDFELIDSKGCTALHKAIYEGNVDIARGIIPLMRKEGLEIQEWYLGLTALHVAILNKKVDIAKELTQLMRNESFNIVDREGGTALHHAAAGGLVDIVKELVSLMSADALEIKDYSDFTPLARALGGPGNPIELVKCMVEKNKKILDIVSNKSIPVVMACKNLKWEVARYLYFDVTSPPNLMLWRDGSQVASLICHCLKAEQFDIARHLLTIDSRLATFEDVYDGTSSPILVLSRMHSRFLREMRLNFWQKLIYGRISMPSPTSVSSEDDQSNQRDLNSSVVSLFRRFVKGLLLEHLGINRIYELKSVHVQMLEFICCMGQGTENFDVLPLPRSNLLRKSIFEAVQRGNAEFVTQVCKANPEILNIRDDKERSIFHVAIDNRQEEIYSLIYGLEKKKRNEFGLDIGKFGSNMLQSAENLPSLSRSKRMSASLQMQRELQWFKEVESVVPPSIHDSQNSLDDLTARELFTKNHEKLLGEAERSIKGTATSCTVVGALIITIMFAVAITFPGGNNGNTGLPMFLDENLFLAFIVSDAISLVFSTTSVIIFLGILISSYAEDDFLIKLPTKMMIGIFTLFISIATMMITFSCALVIMLREKYSWIVLPSIFLTSIPVTSFVWVLFPFLFQTFISTYGPGMFKGKSNRGGIKS